MNSEMKMQLLLSFFEAGVLTSGIFIANKFLKAKMTVIRYVIMFVSFWIVFFISSSEVYVKDTLKEKTYSEWLETNHLPSFDSIRLEKLRVLARLQDGKLDVQEREFYQDKVKFHLDNAKQTFKDAKNKCAFIPNWNDRRKAEICFTEAIATLAPNEPRSKVAAIVLTLLLEYGMAVLV